MDKLLCFKCNNSFAGIKNFTSHFRQSHGIMVSRSQASGFYCRQRECNKHFLRYDSFIRHLKKHHVVRDSPSIFNQDIQESEDFRQLENINESKNVCFDEFTSNEKLTMSVQSKKSIDISASALRMVANLRASTSFTEAALSKVVNATDFFVSDISDYVKSEILNFLKMKNIELEDPEVTSLLRKFDFNNLFNNMDTAQGQIETLKKCYNYIEATEIPLGHRNDQRLDSKNQEAPTVMDVRGWVKKRDEENVKEESLVSILDSGIVKPTHRQELVRLAISEMSQLHNNTLYPTAQIKEQLAKDIILAFPKLRSMLTICGYEHFYDRKTNTGFIEFRLKSLRLKLPSKDKKRAASAQLGNKKKLIKSVENESLLDEENFKLKVSELALKMPNDTNKELILKLTDETRANRLNEIKTSDKPMTVAAILKKYPRFKDFNGELISREFSAVFPENDIFLGTFSAFYAPRILQYCREAKSHLLQLVKDLEDNNLKALVLLPELLPSPNYTKRRETSDKTKSSCKTSQKRKVVPKDFSQKVVPNQNLLQFIHASDDLLLQLAPANRGTRNVQPFLVCPKRRQERRGIYYIMTDGHLIQIGDNAIIAFDILLKLHYCFDVEFASDLVNFYDFITGCVMKLHKPKGCSIALETTLQNVMLKENNESDDEIEIQDDEIVENN